MTDDDLFGTDPIEQNIPTQYLEDSGSVCYSSVEKQSLKPAYQYLPLKPIYKETIVAILTATEQNQYCSFKMLQDTLQAAELTYAKATVHRRLKLLQEAGLLEESQIKREGMRRFNLYQLNEPILGDNCPDEIKLQKSQSSQKGVAQQKIRQSHEEALMDTDGDKMIGQLKNHRSLRDPLMMGVLNRALRLNQHDTRTVLNTILHVFGEEVSIKTTTQTDSSIAVLTDQRYIAGIIAYITGILIEHLPKCLNKEQAPENEFLIDMNKFMELLQLQPSNGNKATAYRAFKRLYSTNFELSTNDHNSHFSQRFMSGFNEVGYRFLTELKSVRFTDDELPFDDSDDQVGRESKTYYANWVRISIHSDTFKQLVEHLLNEGLNRSPGDVKFYIQNPALLRERSGIAHSIFSYLSWAVGVRGNTKKIIKASELHEVILPSSRYRNFLRDLLNVVEKNLTKPLDKTPGTVNKITLYGYHVEATYIPESKLRDKRRVDIDFAFYRDKNDPYIGDASAHAKRLATDQKKKSKSVLANAEAELGKKPDDIDIPSAQIFVNPDGPQPDTEDYELFTSEE